MKGSKKVWYGNNFKLGILGGGQLGRMIIQEAISLNVHIYCLDPDPNAPCSQIANGFTNGSITDYQTVLDFAKDKDVVTVEIENVNIEALKAQVAAWPGLKNMDLAMDGTCDNPHDWHQGSWQMDKSAYLETPPKYKVCLLYTSPSPRD